jgi:hypothetical protein
MEVYVRDLSELAQFTFQAYPAGPYPLIDASRMYRRSYGEPVMRRNVWIWNE